MEKLCFRTRKLLQVKNIVSLNHASAGPFTIVCRFLSSTEVSTALRPFYFSVHPDLFGQYPTERSINENSLKQLSSYLETIQQNRPPRPTTVTFYLRSGKRESTKGSFRPVRISLAQRDLRKTVLSILKTCDLPTTYVDNIEPLPGKPEFFKIEDVIRKAKFDENDPAFGMERMQQTVKKAKDLEKLRTWLDKNVGEALEKLASCRPVRDEILRLEKTLQGSLGLQAVVWDCGWNVTHFRGCLLSFQSLAKHHPDNMHVLRGRKLMFANDTGVSLNGDVMLNSGEVRSNWLDMIKNLHTQDAALLRIPAFEKAVSQVLRNIRIVRRKFQPKVMAKHYESHLRHITTSLSDHQGKMGYPKDWPTSLVGYELVVETEAGPLMLSPTGQFIVPASCPAFLLIAFISNNLEEASRLLIHYNSNKHVERDLHKRCIAEFELAALQKDDNITPDLMIACCERLLSHKAELLSTLRGVHLWVTNYYSVLSDGEMCIPWNWKM